jgi:hypothetical protein
MTPPINTGMRNLTIFMIALSLIFVNACTSKVPVTKAPIVSETKITLKPKPKDRCADYLPDIRAASIKYLGIGYPYWYNVGMAITESSCRGNLISFDGGIGLFQLTPSTGITKEISKFIPVDPYNTESNIRAHAYYMYRIINVHFKQSDMTIGKSKYKFNPSKHVEKCGLRLADIHRYYNGGAWFFAEANIGPLLVCSNNEMASRSVRGGTCVGKQYLSFGQINYSYPIKVWAYAQPYKGVTDGSWKYWYTESDKVLTMTFPVKICP